MRILKEEPRSGKIRVRTETLDDLWELSHIIAPGDAVRARTERKLQLGDDRSKQVRKAMTLTVEVEKAELEHGVLRVAGIITDGPDDLVSFGDHHSILVEEGTEITITKTWDAISKQRLSRAAKSEPMNVLLVVFDREQAELAELSRRGYTIIQTLKGDVAKKQEGGGQEDFFKSIATAVKGLDERKSYTGIIAASPAFWNEYLLKALPEAIRKKTTPANCSSSGEAGIKEVLKRPELSEALRADRTSKEERLVAELLEAIGKDKACYGMDECKEKITLGQVRLLLVTMNAVEHTREAGTYDQLDAAMQEAEGMQADVHLIEHAAEQVDALGGIAGVLRW